jgi:signal transduction histidine kinase
MQAVAGQPGERIVTVRMRRAAGDWLQVIVEDTGPGISEEQRTRIFEPFYTTKGTGAGSGLGLPVTNGIVEEHGGSLRIEPRTGGGARAVATLPAFTELTVQPEAE